MWQYLYIFFHYSYQFTEAYWPFSLIILVSFFYLAYRFLILSKIALIALSPFHGKITRVVRCADGDTIVVGNPRNRRRRQKVRLIGVDTPESLRSLYQDIMPYGKEASAYTRKRLKKGRRIFLIYGRAKRDRFGRLLAYVYLDTGEFFNATLVKKGYAFADAHPPNVKYAKLFQKSERKAKRRRRGLWSIYNSKSDLKDRYERSAEYRRFRQRYG